MKFSTISSNDGFGQSVLNPMLIGELARLREKHGFPGATCAYVLSDGTLGEVAYGLADVEHHIPMTTTSRMLIASIGKTFVAATVISLVKDGLLHFDRPISAWLGSRHWYHRLPNHETITVRHLLTHGSGLPDHVHSPKFFRTQSFRVNAHDFFSPEILIECVLDQPPLFAAGQGWAYTDTGYILLGLVIEAVTKDSYYHIVRKRFLELLKLKMTSPADRPVLSGLVPGYVSSENPFGLPIKTVDKSGSMVWNPIVEWTGGGLISTSRDLAVWAKLLYEGQAMQASYLLDLFQSVSIGDEISHRYGAGVLIREQSVVGTIVGHGGIIPGYSSSTRYYWDAGVAVAFQVNTDEGASDFVNDIEFALAKVVLNVSIE